MKKKKIILALLLWVACFIFNRGYLIGGITMKFPAYQQSPAMTAIALTGPFALPVSIVQMASGAPYMWHGYTCQQRWDAWDAKSLGKKQFLQDGNFDCVNFNPSTEAKETK